MPDDFRVAVAGCLIGQDGIAAVFRECPAVETVGNALDGWIARRRVDTAWPQCMLPQLTP